MNPDLKQRLVECLDNASVPFKKMSHTESWLRRLLMDCRTALEEREQQITNQNLERLGFIQRLEERLQKAEADLLHTVDEYKQLSKHCGFTEDRLQAVEKALKHIMEASGTSTLQWKIANDVLQPKAQ